MTNRDRILSSELAFGFGALMGCMFGFLVGMLAVFASDHNPLGFFG